MHDLTRGEPIKVILRFTAPLLIGSIFQLTYNFADSIIVGHTLGESAFAAIGTTGSMIFFILGFAQGMTSGFAVVLAQRVGANDITAMKRSFFTGLCLSVIIGFLLSASSVIFLKQFLQLMQTPPDLIDLAYRFLVVIFLGAVATILYNYLSNTIRATGDSKTPLVALIIAVILNVFMDLIFILVFKWGVTGAAIATVCAQTFSVCFLLRHIYQHLPSLRLTRKDCFLTQFELYKHLQMGLPMGFQASIIAIGTMTLQNALNQIGTTAVAAHAIASKTDQLAMSPMVQLGIAVSTFTAQNYGAKRFERIVEGVKRALTLNVLWAIIFAILLISAHQFFSSLFLPNGTAEIYHSAYTYFVVNGICYWILAILFTLRGFIQGLGKSFAPTLAGIMELIMRVVVARIGLATVGFTGIVLANPAAWIGSVMILIPASVICFRRLKKNE